MTRVSFESCSLSLHKAFFVKGQEEFIFLVILSWWSNWKLFMVLRLVMMSFIHCRVHFVGIVLLKVTVRSYHCLVSLRFIIFSWSSRFNNFNYFWIWDYFGMFFQILGLNFWLKNNGRDNFNSNYLCLINFCFYFINKTRSFKLLASDSE